MLHHFEIVRANELIVWITWTESYVVLFLTHSLNVNSSFSLSERGPIAEQQSLPKFQPIRMNHARMSANIYTRLRRNRSQFQTEFTNIKSSLNHYSSNRSTIQKWTFSTSNKLISIKLVEISLLNHHQSHQIE